MNQEQIALERLKDCVRKKISHDLESPADFEYLEKNIYEQTNQPLSATTLKRIFGYLPSSANPRRSSLAILARYVGYSGWEDFLNSIIVEDEEHPAEEPAIKTDNVTTLEQDTEKPTTPQPVKTKKINTLTLTIVLALIAVIAIVAWWKLSTPNENISHLKVEDNGVALSEQIANQYDEKTRQDFTKAMEDFLEQENYLRETISKSRQERDSFVHEFPVSRISSLTREEYDINNKKGFAYRLKNNMDWMGAFYDVDSSPYDCKGFTDEQFRKHLDNIANLLNDGAIGNKKAINDNPLYKPLKYRLLTIYYPDSDYMPFWLDREVTHFINVLLPDTSVRSMLTPENCIDERDILYNYKNTHPIMKGWDNFMFMDFVFMFFPKWSGEYKGN